MQRVGLVLDGMLRAGRTGVAWAADRVAFTSDDDTARDLRPREQPRDGRLTVR